MISYQEAKRRAEIHRASFAERVAAMPEAKRDQLRREARIVAEQRRAKRKAMRHRNDARSDGPR